MYRLLSKSCGTSDESVRLQAVKALKTLGSQAHTAEATLADLANHDADADVRRLASEAIEAIKTKGMPGGDTRLLIERLERADASVRLGAVKALKTLGPAGRAAIPKLTRMAESDPDEDVQTLAKKALKALMPVNVKEETAKIFAKIDSLENREAVIRYDLVWFRTLVERAQPKVLEAIRGD